MANLESLNTLLVYFSKKTKGADKIEKAAKMEAKQQWLRVNKQVTLVYYSVGNATSMGVVLRNIHLQHNRLKTQQCK